MARACGGVGVIARLVAERDEARFHLTQQQQQQPAAAAAAPAAAAETAAMDVEEGGSIPAAVASAMQAKFEELQAGRKGRKPAKTLATPEALAGCVAQEAAPRPFRSSAHPSVPRRPSASLAPRPPSQAKLCGVVVADRACQVQGDRDAPAAHHDQARDQVPGRGPEGA
eukprot:COSAG01_NODE_1314_length_10760_cov_3.305131_8_plen_169_part_00